MTTLIDTQKSKGGRPPKEEYDLRRNKVKVGFTDLEKDTVSYKAQQAGMKPHDYIHDAALYAYVRAYINDEQVELVRNLAKMGNNLNQIAHQANCGGLFDVRDKCLDLLDQISTLITRIVRGGDLSQ